MIIRLLPFLLFALVTIECSVIAVDRESSNTTSNGNNLTKSIHYTTGTTFDGQVKPESKEINNRLAAQLNEEATNKDHPPNESYQTGGVRDTLNGAPGRWFLISFIPYIYKMSTSYHIDDKGTRYTCREQLVPVEFKQQEVFVIDSQFWEPVPITIEPMVASLKGCYKDVNSTYNMTKTLPEARAIQGNVTLRYPNTEPIEYSLNYNDTFGPKTVLFIPPKLNETQIIDLSNIVFRSWADGARNPSDRIKGLVDYFSDFNYEYGIEDNKGYWYRVDFEPYSVAIDEKTFMDENGASFPPQIIKLYPIDKLLWVPNDYLKPIKVKPNNIKVILIGSDNKRFAKSWECKEVDFVPKTYLVFYILGAIVIVLILICCIAGIAKHQHEGH